MGAKHTLHITLHSDEVLRVGTNLLQLVVHNSSPVMSYEQIVMRLYAPLGVTLKPAKVEIAPLPANSSYSATITLTTKRPGRHLIKIEANTFPTPKEGEFPRTIQQVEVLPELKSTPNSPINSIMEEITYLEANSNHAPRSSRLLDDESDIYSRYLIGLSHLRRHIEHGHPQYSDFLVYEQQLKENILATQRFGDTENQRARRSELIEHLNKLTRSILNTTFNELCE